MNLLAGLLLVFMVRTDAFGATSLWNDSTGTLTVTAASGGETITLSRGAAGGLGYKVLVNGTEVVGAESMEVDEIIIYGSENADIIDLSDVTSGNFWSGWQGASLDADVTVYGNGGNDIIEGSGFDDVIWGGSGADNVDGNEGDDVHADCEQADSTMTDCAGVIVAHNVPQKKLTVQAAPGSARLIDLNVLDAGTSTVLVTLQGQIVAHMINVGPDFTTLRVYGSESADIIDCHDVLTATDSEIHGNGGDDTITGTGVGDRIYGGPGADTVDGDGGEDYVMDYETADGAITDVDWKRIWHYDLALGAAWWNNNVYRPDGTGYPYAKFNPDYTSYWTYLYGTSGTTSVQRRQAFINNSTIGGIEHSIALLPTTNSSHPNRLEVRLGMLAPELNAYGELKTWIDRTFTVQGGGLERKDHCMIFPSHTGLMNDRIHLIAGTRYRFVMTADFFDIANDQAWTIVSQINQTGAQLMGGPPIAVYVWKDGEAPSYHNDSKIGKRWSIEARGSSAVPPPATYSYKLNQNQTLPYQDGNHTIEIEWIKDHSGGGSVKAKVDGVLLGDTGSNKPIGVEHTVTSETPNFQTGGNLSAGTYTNIGGGVIKPLGQYPRVNIHSATLYVE